MNDRPFPDNPAEFLRKLRQRDFLAFLERAWPHVSGGQLLMPNWHISAIAAQLDRIEAGDCRRLLVNLPPRNGKSIIISIAWIAWMLGRDPTRNFVCVSYSNKLSGKLARDCLSIMQAHWYREIFPRTIISRKRSAAEDFETTAGGGRLSTSVEGTLTGRGGDIIVMDDIIKPEDVHSEVIREANNEWYRSTLISRLNNKATGAMLCVMQRLHQYDLPGVLLEAGGWDQLSLPAIAPEDANIPLQRGKVHWRKAGDILHPEREDAATLAMLRASMGSSSFAAQYLQDPVPAYGNVFKHRWLLTSPPGLGRHDHGEIVQSWDTGIKIGERNDWSVCITALVRPRDIHILDVWRGRLEFPDLVRKCVELARTHQAGTLLVEDKASGQELIQTLRSEKHTGVPMPIRCTPTADKLSRAEGTSSIVEAGQLSLPAEAHWLGEFKSEVLAFPNGRFDDQVDALTQLLDWARTRWSWSQPRNEGPEEMSVGYGNDATYENNPYMDRDPWSGMW